MRQRAVFAWLFLFVAMGSCCAKAPTVDSDGETEKYSEATPISPAPIARRPDFLEVPGFDGLRVPKVLISFEPSK